MVCAEVTVPRQAVIRNIWEEGRSSRQGILVLARIVSHSESTLPERP